MTTFKNPHFYYTGQGWKLVDKPEEPIWYKYAISSGIDVRKEDEEKVKWYIWNDDDITPPPVIDFDEWTPEVKCYPIGELKVEIVDQEKIVWFLEHIMSRAWIVQNNTAAFVWTNIAIEAMQFKTSEDAQKYDDENTLRGHELNCYPTEHIFYYKVVRILSDEPFEKSDAVKLSNAEKEIESWRNATIQAQTEKNSCYFDLKSKEKEIQELKTMLSEGQDYLESKLDELTELRKENERLKALYYGNSTKKINLTD